MFAESFCKGYIYSEWKWTATFLTIFLAFMSSHIRSKSKESSRAEVVPNLLKKEFTVVIPKLPDTAPSRLFSLSLLTSFCALFTTTILNFHVIVIKKRRMDFASQNVSKTHKINRYKPTYTRKPKRVPIEFLPLVSKDP